MKYRNASRETQTLIGYGIVNTGETIEVSAEIENPNFMAVSEETRQVEQPAPVVPPIPAPAPTPDEQPNN